MEYKHTVSYNWYSNYYVIKKVLKSLSKKHPILSLDFEVIPKHNKEQKQELKKEYEKERDVTLLPKINSNGLSFPSLTKISHLSIAWSETEAVVIVCKSNRIRKYIFNWLISIPNIQIWHNAGYDLKHVFYHTNNFPIAFEDTQLILKARKNHCDHQKALTGLKETMGYKYGDWGIDNSEFTEENMYDSKMLLYSATDACATYALFKELNYDTNIKPTVENPIDLLPLNNFPIEEQPKEKDFFYRNVIKPLIPDIIEMSCNGIPINLDEVLKLEPQIQNVLDNADKVFKQSKLVKEYLDIKSDIVTQNKQKEKLDKRKNYKEFLKEFNPKNKTHRTYVINTFLKSCKLYDKYGLEDWNLKDVKKLNQVVPSVFLSEFLNKNYDNPIIEEGMINLAKDKAKIYNEKILQKTNEISVDLEFNPNSSVQIRELLYDYLQIPSDVISNKTNQYNYPREELEKILEYTNILLEKE